MKERIVIDSNVFVAATLSSSGASHLLFSLLPSDKFEMFISVPLILEYEDAAKRERVNKVLSNQEIDELIDAICLMAQPQKIFYLWRPMLKDANDDHVLELAVNGNCSSIITFNIKDFSGISERGIGIKIETPQQFLRRKGAIR
jgi:putative PIN family toxin of toxin-antitoxin system